MLNQVKVGIRCRTESRFRRGLLPGRTDEIVDAIANLFPAVQPDRPLDRPKDAGAPAPAFNGGRFRKPLLSRPVTSGISTLNDLDVF